MTQPEYSGFWHWYLTRRIKSQWWKLTIASLALFAWLRFLTSHDPKVKPLVQFRHNPLTIASWVSLYFYNEILDFMQFRVEARTGTRCDTVNRLQRQSRLPENLQDNIWRGSYYPLLALPL